MLLTVVSSYKFSFQYNRCVFFQQALTSTNIKQLLYFYFDCECLVMEQVLLHLFEKITEIAGGLSAFQGSWIMNSMKQLIVRLRFLLTFSLFFKTCGFRTEQRRSNGLSTIFDVAASFQTITNRTKPSLCSRYTSSVKYDIIA